MKNGHYSGFHHRTRYSAESPEIRYKSYMCPERALTIFIGEQLCLKDGYSLLDLSKTRFRGLSNKTVSEENVIRRKRMK